MKGALWVCERDIRKFLRQPATMLGAVIGPFLTLILLGYAFGGAVTHAPVAVVRQSYGPLSTNFVHTITNQQNCIYGGVDCANAYDLIDVSDLGAAKSMLRAGTVKAVVYIPLGFDQPSSSSPVLTVYLDNTDPISAAAISGLMSQAASEVSAQIQVTPPPDSAVTVDLANIYREVLYIEFMAPGSLIQSIMFASIIGGGISILFDKQRGIIEGYLVTPLKRIEIVVGVLLAGVTKAMFSATTMLILAILVAGVRPMTDIFGFILIFFTLFLTSMGLISMMSAYAVRAPAPEVYQFTAFPINLILYFTSGAVYPIQGFPAWMRKIASINPEAYAIHALRDLMYKGAGLTAVIGDFAFLALFTGLMIALATVAFKRAL
ncbi:MAG TPA: ABC transporter permease [Candidatus Dormibacteraeota bacterium]|nr:ABC transporter permease [Candidatus Dormibacteraeota bacterium]